MNKLVLLLVGVAVVTSGVFFIASKKGPGKVDTNVIQNTNTVLTANFKVPICDQIPKSVIEKALGKTVTETKPISLSRVNICEYFTNKESRIHIGLNRGSYDKVKAGESSMEEVKIEKDPSIKAEHYIVIPIPEPTIVNITIKINEDLYLVIDNGISKDYSRKQVVAVASNIVKHLSSSSK